MISLLYVDDEPSLLEIVKIYLERSEAFSITTAPSAHQALDLLGRSSFDAIVSDYQMPSMDGIAFLKEVRARHGEIPFILFTGKGREEVVIEAINNGADFYIQKGGAPKAQFAELSHKIRKAVERRQAIEAVKNSEQRLSDIIDFLPDATFAIDRSGHVIAWNRAIEEMTGVPATAMLGKGDYEYSIPFYGERRPILIDMIMASDSEITSRYYSIIDKEGNTVTAETSAARPNGQEKTLFVKTSLLYDKRGRLTGAIESIRDISERRLNEDALRESEQRYRNVVEDQTEFISRFLPNGVHIFVNEAYCRYFGRTREEIIGKRFVPSIPREDRAAVQAHFAALSPASPVGTIEHRIVMPDGKVRWQRWSDRAIFDANGIVTEYQSVGRDTTDQKISEEALRDNQLQLGMAMDLAHLVNWVSDAAGTFTFNDQFYALYGTTAAREGGYRMTTAEYIERFVHPHDARLVEDAIGRQSAAADPYTSLQMEHRIVRRDGSVRDVVVRVMVERDAGGGVVRVWGANQDITDRKRAEKALRESERRFRELTDLLPVMVFETDTAGDLTFINRMGSDVTGIVLGGGTGNQSLLERIVPEDRDHARASFGELMAGRPAGRSNEYTLQRKDGERIRIAVHSSPIHDSAGSVCGLRGFMIDITRRKRAEEALRTSESRLRSIINLAPVGIVTIVGRILREANDRTCQITGYSADELVGQPARMLYATQDDYDRAGGILYSNANAIGTGTVETRWRKKDGTLIDVLVSSSPVDPTNTDAGFTCTALDITERKLAEDALYKRVVALTEPLEPGDIAFTDLFSIDDIQKIQDAFCTATGVASLITLPDGTPITRPSNFCRLCKDIVRRTEKGLANCQASDTAIGKPNPDGPIVVNCLSAGLCNAGASIVVGGKHVANWLIGQVRNESAAEERILAYAREIGADEEEFRGAFAEVPFMRQEQFERIADFLFVLASELSIKAYQNVQQSRFINERRTAEDALRASEEKYRSVIESIQDVYYRTDAAGRLVMASPTFASTLGYRTPEECLGKDIAEAFYYEPGQRKKFVEAVYAEDRVVSYEVVLKKADGSPVVVSTSSHLYRDREGRVLGIEGIFRDITDRKRIETALEKSEERLRRAMAASSDGLFDWNMETGAVYFSPQYFGMLGYMPEDLPAAFTTWEDLLHPFDRDAALATIDEYLEGQRESHAMEFRLRKKDGGWKWIESKGKITGRNADGKPVRIVGTHTDITERKEAERRLRQTKDMFQAFVDHSYDAIFVSDLNGRIVDVNATTLAMYHITRDEALGLTIDDFSGPESLMSLEESQKIWNEVLEGKDYVFPWQARRPTEGTFFYVEVYLTRIEVDNQPVVLANVRDVTERRRMEKALRESEEKYRTLVENANEALIIAQDGVFVFVNQRMAEFLGVPAGDLVGRPFIDFIWPEDREMVMANYSGRIAGEPSVDAYDLRMMGAEGNELWMSLSAAAIQWKGRPATLNLMTNITARKQAEEALFQTNRKLTLLSGITRHDIVNKLAVLRGYVDVARDQADDPALDALLEKVDAAAAIINNQIEFTRTYESLGSQKPRWQQLAAAMPTAHLPAEISFAADLDGFEVYADTMLEKVFSNLLDNSVRHGGRVSRIAVAAAERDGGLVITWDDDGVGIPADEKTRIFDRGYGKHTGLGLFLAREILAITGISIGETGEPGKGARFELTVPGSGFRRTGDR